MHATRTEDFTKVWEELERRLRRRLTDLEKDYLIMRRLAGEIAGDLSDEEGGSEEGIQTAMRELAWLRGRVVTTPEVKMTARSRKVTTSPAEPDVLEFSGTHAEALSFLLADEAARDDKVAGFRARRLGGTLLAAAEVEPWILSQTTSDGPATQYVQTPVPGDVPVHVTMDGDLVTADGLPLSQGHLTRQAATAAKMLYYYVPGEGVPKFVVTASMGVLEELRSVGEHLVRELRWGQSEATVFILTGLTPLYGEIWAEQEWDELRPLASRITLKVCPTVTPQEVARIYHGLRAQILSGRYVHIQPRQAALVAFAFPRLKRGMTWEEIRQAWNASEAERYERGTFSALSYLRSTYSRARRALLSLAIDTSNLPGSRDRHGRPLSTEPGHTIVSVRFRRSGFVYQLLRQPPAEEPETR